MTKTQLTVSWHRQFVVSGATGCVRLLKTPQCSSLWVSVLKREANHLPTDSMQKSKLSSEANFLLDFSFPCKFTIFTNSQEKWKNKYYNPVPKRIPDGSKCEIFSSSFGYKKNAQPNIYGICIKWIREHLSIKIQKTLSCTLYVLRPCRQPSCK